MANFLGTANVLQGTMSAGKDGSCVFQSENGVVINLGTQSQNEGAIVFRPQNVRISKAFDIRTFCGRNTIAPSFCDWVPRFITTPFSD